MATYKVKPSPVLTGASATRFMEFEKRGRNTAQSDAAQRERKRLEDFYNKLKSNSKR